MFKNVLTFVTGTAVGAFSLQYFQHKKSNNSNKDKVAVVKMSGEILPRWMGQGKINAEAYYGPLKSAFEVPGVKAVALVINSPGGSPAQSSLINKQLTELCKEHSSIPLLAFVEDIAASGGYYIACAADEIIANECSIVGSIGVISSGFGFNKAMEKLGIERRVLTAGASKHLNDPFLEENERGVLISKKRMESMHNIFIDAVKAGRGNKLQLEIAAEKARAIDRELHIEHVEETSCIIESANVVDGMGIFDGSVYVGKEALELGLIDSLGEMRSVIKKRFGKDIMFIEMKPRRSLLERVGLAFGTSFGTKLGQGLAHGVIGEVYSKTNQYILHP